MEAIINNLIRAVGWSIFHSLWQGAIVYGILLLLITALPKCNAKTKHNLAFAAICCIFVGFCISFATIFKLPETINANDPIRTFSEYPDLAVINLPQELNSKTEYYFPFLVSTYGIGLLLQIFVLLAGYGKLMQLKKAHRNEVPAEWHQVFVNLLSNLGIRRNITFHLSELVNVPLVIGYFKPAVLFPIALATQLDLKQVEAILIHELSHIRRNDYLLNLIKTGIETLLFFNPFVWLSSRFISIEREHACDDLVIRYTGTPITYAHALLKLEILKDKSTPALSMAATGKNQHLYQRIKRITNMQTNYMNPKQKIFAFTLTIATIASLAWINPSKKSLESASTSPGNRSIEIAETNSKSKVLDLAELQKAPLKIHKQLPADTSKKKKVVKIITVDAKGNKQEYNSVKEMPDSIRNEVIYDTFSQNFDFIFRHNLDSITTKSLAFVKSPEFKAHIEEVKANAEKVAKMHNSPEFKAQIELMKDNSAKIAKQFNSREWKKHQEELQKNAEKLRLKFDSPEWKKELQEMKELHKSSEYKELKERFEKDLQKLKKKKGIKTDVTSRIMSDSSQVNIVLNYRNL